MLSLCFFFFFQAEGGIRDYKVTGVQTCALPICPIFMPGDGTISIATRGDLVFGGAGDPGMGQPSNADGMAYNGFGPDGTPTFFAKGGNAAFTLWMPTTSINLYAAGGDVAPLAGQVGGSYANN